MSVDGNELHVAIAEASTTSTPHPDSEREKLTPVVSVTVTEDRIDPIHINNPENSTISRVETGDKAPSDSKSGNVHVHVSRRSTETGDSKTSKRRFGFIIRWPTTMELGPRIHWYTPTMMVLLALAGLFGGLGHHLYNATLEGRPVNNNDAQWPQRWGVAMAFFVKMTLVGAVQMAVKQRAWVSDLREGIIQLAHIAS